MLKKFQKYTLKSPNNIAIITYTLYPSNLNDKLFQIIELK